MTLHHLQVDQASGDRWCLRWPDGSRFDDKTYKRAQDCKRERTLLLKK